MSLKIMIFSLLMIAVSHATWECVCNNGTDKMEGSLHNLCRNTTLASQAGLSSNEVENPLTYLNAAAVITASCAVFNTSMSLLSKVKPWWDNMNVSNLTMDINEILPTTMDPKHREFFEQIDKSLNNFSTWKKFPLYGAFKSSPKGWWEGVTSRCYKDREYLYGYQYENEKYVLEIKAFFSDKALKDITPSKHFRIIHPAFKEFGIGIKETPRKYALSGPSEHDHVTDTNMLDVKNHDDYNIMTKFMNTILRDSVFLKETLPCRLRFKAVLEGLINKINEEQKTGITDIEAQSSSQTDAGSSDSNNEKQKITIFFPRGGIRDSDDDSDSDIKAQNIPFHFYFLFPTLIKNSENQLYSILFHIQKIAEDEREEPEKDESRQNSKNDKGKEKLKSRVKWEEG